MMTCEIGLIKVNMWLSSHLSPDADLDFCWTDAEIGDLHDNTTFVIAADGKFAESTFHNYPLP